jgi:hypothetical protein
MSKSNETLGNAVPNNKRRGCMCKDGTYSRKCCDGTLRSQGVGRISGVGVLLLESGGNILQENGQNIKL